MPDAQMPTDRSATTVTVREPQLALGGVFSVAGRAVQEIGRSRYLIWKLFMRDFHAQFRQKILGYHWAVIAPFFTVFGFVLLHAAGILAPGDTGVPYPLYVFVGLASWNVLVGTITAVSTALITQGELILKTNVPKIALAIAAFAQVIYGIVIQLVTIAILMAVFGVAPSALSPLFIPALLPMLLLGFAIGLVASAVGGIARDLSNMIQTGLSLLMFLTPVVFVASTVGNRYIQLLIWLNPLTYLVEVPRALLLFGGSDLWPLYCVVSAATVAILLVAIKAFYLVQDLVAERL
jgi:lipopolysaccharide transport system permease protein